MPFVRRKRGQLQLVHNHRAAGARVRQAVLHAFAAPEELRRLLETPGAWAVWREDLAWRFPDYDWSWSELRDRLEAELGAWGEEATGALHRRADVVARLAGELRGALQGVSPARASDAVLVELVREPLGELLGVLTRLLAPRESLASAAGTARSASPAEADGPFEQGMDCWERGEQAAACKLFRRALALDPLHADAHNHLGIVALDRGRLAEAERHFRAAVEGGARSLSQEHGRVEWSFLENRPFLRGMKNLALALSRRGEWAEALEVFTTLLARNPDDHQGARFLLGEAYHRMGRLDDAVAAYERETGEPGVCFSLALALHSRGDAGRVGVALLRGFAANRYVAPLLLGERWQRLDGFHGTNMAEPEWAADYVARAGDQWRQARGSAEALRSWWHAAPVRAWRAQLDDVIVQLAALPVGEERTAMCTRSHQLASEETLLAVARQVDPDAQGTGPRTGGARRKKERSPT